MHRKYGKSLIPSSLYTRQGVVGDEDELADTLISADSEIHGHHIVLEGCLLDRARVAAAPSLRITKSRLNTIDAANADFEHSGWSQIHIADSRFTGARLNNAVMSDVVFERSRMDLMQLQQAKLKRVRFDQCDLRGAYFNGSRLPGTVFEGSNLTGADFSGSDITGSDLRRAIIEDIHLAPDQLQKVIVTSDQALYLARLFGLDVRE